MTACSLLLSPSAPAMKSDSFFVFFLRSNACVVQLTVMHGRSKAGVRHALDAAPARRRVPKQPIACADSLPPVVRVSAT